MMDHFNNSSAPFIPQEPTFNEKPMRDSKNGGTKKKGGGGLAALLKQDDGPSKGNNLTFDEKQYK